jgi:hypothetical protein
VVKQIDAADLRIVVAAVLVVAADAVLITQHLLKLVLIWLPHWPACMCKISREEAAWRREASRGK